MHKGGRPCGRSAATLNRERDKEEKSNPEKMQRRLEEDEYKKTNFFAGHTPATLSPGADTVSATVLDSEAVLVHESLPHYDDRLEDRLCCCQKSTKFVCGGVLLCPSLTQCLRL